MDETCHVPVLRLKASAELRWPVSRHGRTEVHYVHGCAVADLYP